MIPRLSDIAHNRAAGSSDRRVPAVVIGGELNGLGVCRSLGAGGVPIWVVDRKRSNPALWSRYARRVVADTLHGPGFVAFLRDLRTIIGEPAFLVVTDELALLTISEHRSELEGLYGFRLPPHDTVMMLHDKARFYESAMERGWPVPKGVVLRDAADIHKITSLRPPMILKPADKRHFHEGHAPRLITAESHADARLAAETLLALAGEVLVQETIEGPDENIYFCLFYRGRDGETPAMFTGQKLASSPPGIGSTAFCKATVNDELEHTTKAFLDQVNYSGFGGIEYKWDARSARFLIIEPTVGRTDWQEEVATLAGINIPLLAYRHELDLRPLPASAVDGRVVWQGSWIERIRFGAKPIPPQSVVVDAFWRKDDPLPALVHYPCNVAATTGAHTLAWYRLLRERLRLWEKIQDWVSRARAKSTKPNDSEVSTSSMCKQRGSNVDLAAKLSVHALLRCPRCKSGIVAVEGSAPARAFECENPDCEMSQAGFPALDGVPVLVDFDNSVLEKEQVQLTAGSSYKDRSAGFLQRLQNILWRSSGPTAVNADRFIAEAKRLDSHPTILVIGGGAIGNDAEALYRDPDLTLIGTDIYKSDLTLIVADGHQLPLASGAIHGVWIQAVLEHVLTPDQVVAEIHRVLVPDGVVYAETPFMQQVHEGAYDFTRFTLSGHRWLFRHFEETDSGITRGPAIVMLWSIRYFVASLFGSYKIGTIAATGLFWLRHFEKLSRPRFAVDSASAVYFLGRRSERAIKPKDMIAYYKGAQRYSTSESHQACGPASCGNPP